jgi:aryl-alcohol dehydrogenase-like predicted oxidoreductase
MQSRLLGRLGPVSALSLGGGGIGGTWGPRTRSESVATVRAAIDAGITLIDVAPAYGNGESELVVGDAFDGQLPPGVRIATKCALFARWSTVRERLQRQPFSADLVIAAIEDGVRQSLARLKLPRLDVLFLHDPIVPYGDESGQPGLAPSLFVEVVRPTFERLVADGRIAAWGISATGVASAVIETLNDGPAPYVAQIEANVLRSRSATGSSDAAPGATELIAAASRRGVGVMCIRPTQSGALTDGFDRPVDDESAAQFRRAEPFRISARELGVRPALLAHRYALSIPGVSTVTLGVKNREELRDALDAESQGPLPAPLVDRIDTAVSALTS